MFENGRFRNIFSSRSLLAGLVFFLVCIGSSFLYNRHVRRTTQDELARSDVLLQQRERKDKTPPAADTIDTSSVNFERAETPLETDNAQALAEGRTFPSDAAAPIDLSEAFLSDDFVSEAKIAEPVPVSPFGYGPYPEVPSDYFGEPIWVRKPHILSDFPDEARRNIELIDRVLVKLWQQGHRGIVGGSTFDGKIYPHYDDVVYVRWKETAQPDGSVLSSLWQIGGYEGPDLTSEDFRTGNIPSNLEVIDLDDAGYDPYQFLNLQDDGY